MRNTTTPASAFETTKTDIGRGPLTKLNSFAIGDLAGMQMQK